MLMRNLICYLNNINIRLIFVVKTNKTSKKAMMNSTLYVMLVEHWKRYGPTETQF